MSAKKQEKKHNPIVIYDAKGEQLKTLQSTIKKHQNALGYDEKTPHDLLRMFIRNSDKIVGLLKG